MEVAEEWHPQKNDDLRPESVTPGYSENVFWTCRRNPLSFGAPKPATHRRPKPATVWGVLNRRIVLFGPVGKGRDQVVAA